MNFIDKTLVVVEAGAGGAGAVSFRHEKFVDRGGPDGGDGGNGGNVVFEASTSENTLAAFRNQPRLTAGEGQPGSKVRRHGKNGDDLVVKVPVGTQIIEDDNILADLTEAGQRAIVANGGRGGFGNAHFVSSVRQAPKFAEKGEPGEAKKLTLELKMIADVGLVGLPNAGKSTLLARLSNAKPEIADYPFTTLTPNLGVVDVGDSSLLLADIPGLIEGAASGKGLGHEFLRHVERTAVLIHLIDAYQPDITAAYQTINQELADYQVDLSGRPQIIAINKIEGMAKADVDKLVRSIKKLAPSKTLLAISAAAGQGLDELKRAALEMVEDYRGRGVGEGAGDSGLPVIKLADTGAAFKVEKTSGGWRVTGKKIEKFAARTDFDNAQAVVRLKAIMRKMGIIHELARQGAEPGQVIQISDSGNVQY